MLWCLPWIMPAHAADEDSKAELVPSVAIEAVAAEGPVETGALELWFGGMNRGGFLQCWKSYDKRKVSSERHTVMVRFEMAETGKVVDRTLLETTLADETVGSCVLALADSWNERVDKDQVPRLPQEEAPYAATVHLVFSHLARGTP